MQEIKEIIQEKVERHLETVYSKMYPGMEKGEVPKEELEKHSPYDLLMYSWSTMQFKYAHAPKGWTYQREEDAFLLTMMHRHGYGAARRIQLEIRRAWQFRFDWFFKSRSPHEIQKRCDVLIKVVEKELEELHAKEEKEEKERAAKAAFMDKLTSSHKHKEDENVSAKEPHAVQPGAAESMQVESAEQVQQPEANAAAPLLSSN